MTSPATPTEVKDFHTQDDVDSSPRAHHHTLGLGVNQAAKGSDLKKLQELVDTLGLQNPVGQVILGYYATAPVGYLKCDGSAFSILDYPDLAALLGGVNTPDLRDRLPVGASGTKAVGSIGGADTKVIASGNLPVHTHSMAHTHDISHTHTMAHIHDMAHTHNMSHTHTFPIRQTAAAFGTAGAAAAPTASGTLTTQNTNAASASDTGGPSNANTGISSAANTGAASTSNSGASSAANTGDGGFANTALNVQNKYLALNFYIKAI